MLATPATRTFRKVGDHARVCVSLVDHELTDWTCYDCSQADTTPATAAKCDKLAALPCNWTAEKVLPPQVRKTTFRMLRVGDQYVETSRRAPRTVKGFFRGGASPWSTGGITHVEDEPPLHVSDWDTEVRVVVDSATGEDRAEINGRLHELDQHIAWFLLALCDIPDDSDRVKTLDEFISDRLKTLQHDREMLVAKLARA